MYIVIEIQQNIEGNVSSLVFTFNNKNEADSKYHNILSYAAVSQLPRHSAIMLYNDRFLKSESFTHEEENQETTE